MIKYLTLLLVLFFTTNAIGQAPEKMSYQSVLRDSKNNLIINQLVGMQISILNGETEVYKETQTPKTNTNGLVSLEIGAGSVIFGVFKDIDWGNGVLNIKTEIDPTGSNKYSIIGKSQMLSVPYAMYAKTAENGISEVQSQAIKLNSEKYSKVQIDSIIKFENNIMLDSLKNLNQKFDSIIGLLSNKINKIENSTKTDVDNLKSILPKKLYFSLDKEFKIFTNNFIFKSQFNPSTARIYFSNLNGVHFKNHFSGKPKNEGKWMGQIRVYENLNPKNESTHEYNIVKKGGNLNEKNVLFIGDSYTDIGTYISNLKNDFEIDGIKLNLIGTMGNATKRSEYLSGGTLYNTILTSSAGISKIISVTNIKELPVSGYPGTHYQDENGELWTVRGMSLDGNGNGKIKLGFYGRTIYNFNFPTSGKLTKTKDPTHGSLLAGDEIINYNGVDAAYFNSFFNPQTKKVDFKYYIDYWNFKSPDVIVLQFGWNDFAPWADNGQISIVVNSVKLILDQIQVDFPNTKIIYSIPPTGDINNDENIDNDGKLYSILKFSKEMSTLIENNSKYSSVVYIAPSYAWVDSVNGYSSDGVHPSSLGFRQIADCLYPIFCDIFNKN